MRAGLLIAMLALAACSPPDAGRPEAAASTAAAPAGVTPPGISQADAQAAFGAGASVDGGEFALVNPDETAACQAGLRSRGLRANEMWVMMHTPDGICPNAGVDEARIREIVGFWAASGCSRRTPAEMLHALESGACGGDAG
jgi:hypothetical protein